MPKVSEFFGISIYIYWRDHDPPHFHAVYADYQASIAIRDNKVIAGSLPPRALGLVTEWSRRHQLELLRVWGKAQRLEPLDQIAPLG